MTRLDKNGNPYECKTDRRYGVINEIIMAMAKRKGIFTRLDIHLDQDKVRNRLCALVREGRLRIVRRGIKGPHGLPTTYQINSE
jgi:hypothetical protein